MVTVHLVITGYEKILGTPSIQSIIEFLSIYRSVTVKDLQNFTGYSQRTIYDNLKILIDNNFVEKDKRGSYVLTNSRSIQLLAKFYEQILIEYVGNELQKITEKIDNAKTFSEVESDLNNLETISIHFKPIFEKYFPSALQTILLSIQKLG